MRRPILSSHGYVMVFVGVGHHLAFPNGYAYEHRVNAEKKLGRRLREGEIVHHRDRVKTNNLEDNLEVFANDAEHLAHHRRAGSDKRQPGEVNPVIVCGCGCGGTFEKYDECNRPRRWLSGHNDHPKSTQLLILKTIKPDGVRVRDIKQATGFTTTSISKALQRLRASRAVIRVGSQQLGRWHINEKASQEA